VNTSDPPPLSPRIERIQRRIARVDWICAGTLLERTKVCGKPNCRCAVDPAARHGPYYEWNRRGPGGLRHRVISPEQAREIHRAQENYQLILELLEKWEEASVRAILGPGRAPAKRRR
jgi:hypothetical protein